jgi:uncharacterized membrane protein (DUF373 family)
MAKGGPMLRTIDRFETILISALAVMMILVIALAAIELGWIMAKDIFSPPFDLLRINELLEIFGLFLLVLIGIELLHTLRTYFKKSTIHVEVVLAVALIAIARKVIILDLKATSAPTLVGIGTIVVALSVGYFLIRRSHKEERPQTRHLSRQGSIEGSQEHAKTE